MKQFLLGILFVLLVSSCATVYFTNPQPSKGVVVKSFLKEVQGHYADSLLDITLLKNELVVNGEKYRMVSSIKEKSEVLVKYYKDYYFASFKDSTYYSVFMGKFFDNQLSVYMLNPDARSLEVMKRFVPVQTLDAEDREYLIDASAKAFDQLIDNDVFDVVSVLKKLEE
jgi:hypothetical protein